MKEEMFWEWTFDLFFISFGNIAVCDHPNCFLRPTTDCGYGKFDYFGEFNCEHPDADELRCPCKYTWCVTCKTEEERLVNI